MSSREKLRSREGPTAPAIEPHEGVRKGEFADPQAGLRARYKAAWRVYEKARAALVAAGVGEWETAGHISFDFRPFTDLMCGAKGKRTGKPCPLTSIYGNGRCRFHGGLSTGPTTPEGLAKSGRNGRGKAAP